MTPFNELYLEMSGEPDKLCQIITSLIHNFMFLHNMLIRIVKHFVFLACYIVII